MKEFNAYVEFIYLNTKLSKEEARDIAVDSWNAGISKYEVVKKING